ncbi:MAG: hypothetical protein ABSB01_08860 [Streptosporangiaceae bacterium]|jgi:hypothetical protein
MRTAYVGESFPPDVNGVASTAIRVTGQLARRGQEPLVIAAGRASLSSQPGAPACCASGAVKGRPGTA